ncbi:TPA: hypothetical protein ACWMA9_002072 [Klebsiella pneumoniae]
MKNEIEQIAQQNDMSIEFVTWFFNEKKVGCGNVWFMMMAAMWEGWKGRSIEMDKLAAENVGMDGFVEEMLAIAWQGGSADGSDIQEIAMRYGLIQLEVYCADKYENCVYDPGNFDDGDAVYFRTETPATDACLDGIKADGASEFISRLQQCVDEGDFVGDEVAVIVGAIDCGKEFCEQLREVAK